jgi:hypothetical protein
MLLVSQQHVPQAQKDMSITLEQNIFMTTRNVNLFWNRETYYWRYDNCLKFNQFHFTTTI